MRKLVLLFLVIGVFYSPVFSQTVQNQRTPMLGQQAPAFIGTSTTGSINFPDDYWTKWKIIFSHPADFTAVCSSEIMELANMQEDFEKLNTAIMVLSTDGINSHIEWIHSLEAIEIEGKKIPRIRFPLISDPDLTISSLYGMIEESNHSIKRDIRAVYIIDPNNKMSAIFSYPSNVGRNMQEIKRTLIALQTSQKYNILTPVGWKPGCDVMLPSPASIDESRKLEDKKDDDLYMRQWYMWYKKLPEAKKYSESKN
jgi:peroxiredoxin (alkyl hydroperoxide reductase subunit C)